MTSFRDVRRHFPIYSHTMTSYDKNADVSTNMTSHWILYIFLKVLRLLYYHTKPQSSYLISDGFRQGGQYCPPPCQIRGSRTPCQIGLNAVIFMNIFRRRHSICMFSRFFAEDKNMIVQTNCVGQGRKHRSMKNVGKWGGYPE